ncbi:perlucin-like protein [Asterias amurensis]|uniref:perlucin-like protein n=1 Tax=Asterias amurensis TaxID=7602 RepID=UPI003AB7933C
MYDDSSCPESWHYWGNSCYKITETAFTWADAKEECRNLGGVLAAPSSNQENEFIAQLVPDDWIWIDCNDLEVEGIWKCRDDSVEVAYRNWHDGEPNNAIEEDCAAVAAFASWGNNQWFDRSCIISERALCKVAGRPVLHV